MNPIVIMGVAGSGKSSLAPLIAHATGTPLVEGDNHHSQANIEKMRNGIALTDADRAGWLLALAEQLKQHPHGVVLTCSALKKAYRQRLRDSVPDIRFVFLDVTREEAQRRVAARSSLHIFPTTLVASQFAALESPIGEPGVLRVDAQKPLDELQVQVTQWLRDMQPA